MSEAVLTGTPGSRSSRWAAILPLRLAWRELRGGLRGFYVFLGCIALGVAAIAAVGSSASNLAEGLAREGQTILGGDVVFSLIHREADPQELQFLRSRGRISVAATMRAMARTDDGRTALVEVKGVDAQYPLYGAVALDPPSDLKAALAARDGAFGAAVDPALLTRLGLGVGARVHIGAAIIELRARLASEPDKLAGGIALGPRLLMSDAALHATGLVLPGSLIRWHYRVRLADADPLGRAADALAADVHARFAEAGWEVRTRRNASPELGRNIGRFTQFLTLIGLTSLLVGGVGVANAVRSFLDRKRDVIATLKALGATGTGIFLTYLIQVLLLAVLGIAVGLGVGAALPLLVGAIFGSLIPLPITPSVQPEALVVASAYGLLTTLAFAVWPLGRAHDIPVSALFRDEVAPATRLPRVRYVAAAACALAALAALAILLAYDRKVGAVFVGAAAAVFALLRAMAFLLMLAARRAPRTRSSLLRLVLADIHRPGAVTASVVLALGAGLALVVTLTEIDGNLTREFAAGLPPRAPSFFFLDIQQADASRFDAFIREQAPGATFERVPMRRGRIVNVHGVKAEDLRPPPEVAWVLHSDRGITDAAQVPPGSRVVAGTWWASDYAGPPLVSIEDRIARGLELKLGDQIVVNVLGRNVTATVANLRAVDWESLGINFVLVYSPNTFRGAPHADIATLTYGDGGGTTADEGALVKAAAAAFPGVTTVRVKDVLEAVGSLVRNLTWAIRATSTLTIVAAALVLAGAVATGHRHRVYDAVVLKVLGAVRARLLALYALEYLMLGLATSLFAVAVGSVAAALVVTRVMDMSFEWLPGPALAVALLAMALTVGLGLLGTWAALSQKPARVLRHL
jgi:putative ABC transport system permease protein